MFNKRGNSGSIPPNRLKTYGFPRTDFMKRKSVLKDKSPCHNEQRDRQLALLLKIIDDNTKLSSGEIRDMLYDAIDAIHN